MKKEVTLCILAYIRFSYNYFLWNISISWQVSFFFPATAIKKVLNACLICRWDWCRLLILLLVRTHKIHNSTHRMSSVNGPLKIKNKSFLFTVLSSYQNSTNFLPRLSKIYNTSSFETSSHNCQDKTITGRRVTNYQDVTDSFFQLILFLLTYGILLTDSVIHFIPIF